MTPLSISENHQLFLCIYDFIVLVFFQFHPPVRSYNIFLPLSNIFHYPNALAYHPCIVKAGFLSLSQLKNDHVYAHTAVSLFIHSSLDMEVVSMSSLQYLTLPRTKKLLFSFSVKAQKWKCLRFYFSFEEPAERSHSGRTNSIPTSSAQGSLYPTASPTRLFLVLWPSQLGLR